MKKYTLVADPRVEDDLKEARDFEFFLWIKKFATNSLIFTNYLFLSISTKEKSSQVIPQR